MHKGSGINDLRQVGTGSALHTPPWGSGGLKEKRGAELES